MKKTLLLALACVVSLITSAQFVSQPVPAPAGARKAPALAPASLTVGDATNISNGLGVGAGYTLAGAIQLSPSQLASFKGFKITKLSVGIGKTSVTAAKIFVTKDLAQAPAYQQDVTLAASKWTNISLTTPYEVGSDPIYIGYVTNTAASGDYPLAIDENATANPYYGYLGLMNAQNTAVQSLQWSTLSEQGFGGNMCIIATLEGEFFGTKAVMTTVLVDPYALKGSTLKGSASFTNMGETDITSLDYSYSVNGGTPVNGSCTLPAAVTTAKTGTFTFDLPTDECSSNTVAVTIDKVNGIANESTDAASASYIVTSVLVPQMMVIEEATSTLCGYCPRGIVGMEYMRENYPDRTIGLGIHSSLLGDSDPMINSSYNSFINKLVSALPSAVINRIYLDDPNNQYLPSYYNQFFKDAKVPAKIEITGAEWIDGSMDKMKFTTTSTMGFSDSNAKYAVVYAILEDGVGPYSQSNYFTGQTDQQPYVGDWVKYPKNQMWYFDEVVRYVNNPSGMSKSIPAAITENTPYEYSAEVPLTGLKNIQNSAIYVNPDNTTFVALLVNTANGEIVNGAKIAAADVKMPAGVTEQTISWGKTFEGATLNEDGSYNMLPTATLDLDVTTSAGLPITYTMITTTSNLATVADGKLVINAREGVIYLTAIQEGDATHRHVQSTITINVAKKEQRIIWDEEIAPFELNVGRALTAYSTADLPITYTITSSSPSKSAKITDGNILTFEKDGIIKVRASQKGTDSVAKAENVTREITLAGSPSGIETITVDDVNAADIIFNLQGVQVENIEAGNLYIIVKGDKAHKVLVK